MKGVIIDDEKSLREGTRTLIQIYAPEIKIIGEADSVKTGVEIIRQLNPDLVFLDVEMKDGTGFDVLAQFKNRLFSVIFITGHNEYAVKAFRFSAIDYILKPIDPEELEKAIEKAKRNINSGLSSFQIKALETNLNPSQPKRIVLKDSEKVYLVDISDIIRCEAEDNYTRFCLVNGQKLLISTTLKEYETLLSDFSFYRCHQSHLINLKHFSHMDKREGGQIFLKDGSTVPLAHRKKEQFLKVLDDL